MDTPFLINMNSLFVSAGDAVTLVPLPVCCLGAAQREEDAGALRALSAAV